MGRRPCVLLTLSAIVVAVAGAGSLEEMMADRDYQSAKDWLIEQDRTGDTRAGALIALLHLRGQLPPDNEEVLKWLERGAGLGDHNAHSILGLLHDTGFVVGQRDMARSLMHYYIGALGAKCPECSIVLGYRHLHGIGVPKSCDAAVRYYMSASDKVVEQLSSSELIPTFERVRLTDENARNRPTEESTDVIKYFEHAADGGDVSAQVALGQLSEHGIRGVPQDMGKAAMWFRRAANQGDSTAMAQLAGLTAQGLGVPQDNKTALELFQASAKLGNAAGYAGLGHMYMEGAGVERDMRLAVKYFKEAADRGNAEAQYILGTLYYSGDAVDKSHVTALHYFTAAGHQGHTAALYNLAQMHLLGHGTHKSCSLAVRLHKVVAERGRWAAERHRRGHDAFCKGLMEEALWEYISCAMYGDEVCQLNAGWMLSQPVGYYGDDHDQMAVQFWRLAADQGSAIAQRVLGDYCYAEVVSGGVQEAIRRYQQAADRADAQAMFNLGYLHQWGPKQDLHLAKRYYDQAKQASPEAYVPTQLALLALYVHMWWSGVSSSTVPQFRWSEYENAVLALLCVALATVVYIRRDRIARI